MTGPTETLAERPETKILESHKIFIKESKRSSSLSELNKIGVHRFESLGFPHSKHEMYTFVNTSGVVKTNFEPVLDRTIDRNSIPIYSGCEESHITLIDGEYCSDFSNVSACGDGLKITPLDQAVSDPFVQDYLKIL